MSVYNSGQLLHSHCGQNAWPLPEEGPLLNKYALALGVSGIYSTVG
jgi:hypothetical protein